MPRSWEIKIKSQNPADLNLIILRTEKQHPPCRILRGGAFSRILRDNGRIVKRTIERVTTSKYERRRRTEEELKGERGTHIKDNRTNYRACRFVMQSFLHSSNDDDNDDNGGGSEGVREGGSKSDPFKCL